MPSSISIPDNTGRPQADDAVSLERLFGASDGLLPLWIAEPYLPVAQPIVDALQRRADAGWYGYEIRDESVNRAFRTWVRDRHGWDVADDQLLVSPSLGTSIGAALELVTNRGDGVILQPPVFTDFKPLVTRAHRKVARNSLILDADGYTMDLAGLAELASRSEVTAMILCNPHNPVGRVWTRDELVSVAEICSRHGVFVIADEIHADIVLTDMPFTPFALAAHDTGVRSISLHGAIKTFGLAGIADTLIFTEDEVFASAFEAMSSRLHLTRNNVFALAAIEAAYTHGERWLDTMLELVSRNVATLLARLPHPVQIIPPEGTYLAWIDFRDLGMDVPELARWLANDARLALSPGHWFGREGAGFARMSIAAPTEIIDEAAHRITAAVGR